MTPAPGLIPTPVVDKRGRQTTVYKKPQDGAQGLQSGIPAPTPAPAVSKPRAEREKLVSGLFSPPKYVPFVERKLCSLSDESVEIVGKCAGKINDKAAAGGIGSSVITEFAHTVSAIDSGSLPEEILPYMLRGVDYLTDEFKFSDMKAMYVMSMGNGDEPSPDNVLDAHLSVARDYFTAVLESSHDIAFKYMDNTALFDMVGRHPDKADIILKHREKYHPEVNGTEAFEADLDSISELNKSISEGWL